MGIKLRIYFLLIVCLLLSFDVAIAEKNPLRIPKRFPNLTFTNILSKEDQSYLGISEKKIFTFKNIKGDLILIDLTNTYCISCQKNIRIFNEIYNKIQNDPSFKNKIKIIGIAVGNNRTEVENFKKEHNILYPILIDPDFTSYEAMGEPRVPFTLFIKRDARKNSIIFETHKGMIESVDDFMNNIKIIISEHFKRYAF